MTKPTETSTTPVIGRLGRIGLWTDVFDRTPAQDIGMVARAIESAELPSVWIPEVRGGREGLTLAGILLQETDRLVVANGIVKISERTPSGLASAAQLLADAHPGRHLLGVGLGAVAPGSTSPLRTVETYLRDMKRYQTALTMPMTQRPTRVLAAYGPAMTRLAASATDGAHTYLVPVEHTAQTRELLGTAPLLAVEQTVVIDDDPTSAREQARDFLAVYLTLGFNRKKFARLGYSDGDLDHGGSDRLVDDLVAHGNVDTVRARIEEHLGNGANHVAVQFLGARTPSDFVAAVQRWAPRFVD